MIEIKHRFTKEVIYKSETAETVAQAVVETIQKAKEESRIANLSYSDLSWADLSYSNLNEADLSYSNLRGSNLSYSDLSYSDLSYSNLSGSNLSYSNLSGSNLSEANLSRANLRGSNLSEANLSRANLSRANRVSLGFDDRGYHFFLSWEDDQRIIRAGCRVYTMADARKHWTGKPEILARLDLADAIAESRNWKDVA